MALINLIKPGWWLHLLPVHTQSSVYSNQHRCLLRSVQLWPSEHTEPTQTWRITVKEGTHTPAYCYTQRKHTLSEEDTPPWPGFHFVWRWRSSARCRWDYTPCTVRPGSAGKTEGRKAEIISQHRLKVSNFVVCLLYMMHKPQATVHLRNNIKNFIYWPGECFSHKQTQKLLVSLVTAVILWFCTSVIQLITDNKNEFAALIVIVVIYHISIRHTLQRHKWYKQARILVNTSWETDFVLCVSEEVFPHQNV